ncbi:phosphotransferase enzyme family protein [Lederbergia citri]|uniref:Phosphotransferase n=1 Tax=Lederbergia citri TaxID=2833580 RepID=A0A942YJQ1_9BACI|nr:phosphotransferase [Lederbergia citri]MBS4197795.1 phosphotransferase [Lederbergia citri]
MDQHPNNVDESIQINDNAGSGRRGLRAVPSIDLLNSVRDAYNLPISNDIFDLGGSSNLNLLVTADIQKYVIRVYRPYVNEGRLQDIQYVRRKLKEGGVPTSEEILTKDGQSYIIYDHRLVEVETYIKSDGGMDTWDLVQKALPLLGHIHTILKDVHVSTPGKDPFFANYIKPEDVLGKSRKGIQRIKGWGNLTEEEKQLADATEELAELVSAYETPFISKLPHQLVHGDFWDNNVFFQQDQIVLVTDFDFMGERTRIDDLALTLYFLNFHYESTNAGDRLTRLSSLANVYDQGLAERLSNDERKALPLALARQPLWSIGGWIAFLDNEKAARNHAQGMLTQVKWALNVMKELDKWQEAFQSSSKHFNF